jgi:glycerol-3-phosphate dehydrogenase
MTLPPTSSAGTGRLSPDANAAALDAMAVRQLDILVVGGGVVGAGVALDAVTRGLTVGLVEGRDWAAGTSGASSMFVHGGLRHLQDFDLRGVREALRERNLLLDTIAPHLVRRVPLLYPLHARFPERAYVGAALMAYDTLAEVPGRRRALPPHRHLARRTVKRIAPGLSPEGMTGAVQFWEAQVDDARFVLTAVRTAAAYGALVASSAPVTGLTTEDGTVTGAWVRADGGRERHLRAKVVIAAAGPWTPQLATLVDPESAGNPGVRTQGVHLVVPRHRIRSTTGLIVRTGASPLVIAPWGRHWVVGTSSEPASGDGDRPRASGSVIDTMLTSVNPHLTQPLTRDDVEAEFTGLWPRSVGGERPVTQPRPGLVLASSGTDTGFTTYRLLAERAVDAAVAQLGGLVADCVTPRLSLLGADGYHARWNQRHLLARQAGLHVARLEHLLRRYGSLAEQVLDMMRADPALKEPVPGAEDYLAAEMVYAVTHEGARHLVDILDRRTRILRETRDAGQTAAPHVARLVADRLGWDGPTLSREIGRYVQQSGGGMSTGNHHPAV